MPRPHGRTPLDLTGQRFGRLVALSRQSRGGLSYWTCQCDCGNLTEVNLSNLRRTQSCGCLTKESLARVRRQRALEGRPIAFKHGLTGSALYVQHRAMLKVGTLHPAWRDIKVMHADIGKAPFEGALIMPVRVHEPCGPDNYRWGTAEERRTRYSPGLRLITHNGVTKSCAAWARDLDITRQAMDARLAHGWSAERAVTAGKLTSGRKQTCMLTINGETKSVMEWSKTLGAPYATLYARYSREKKRQALVEQATHRDEYGNYID